MRPSKCDSSKWSNSDKQSENYVRPIPSDRTQQQIEMDNLTKVIEKWEEEVKASKIDDSSSKSGEESKENKLFKIPKQNNLYQESPSSHNYSKDDAVEAVVSESRDRTFEMLKKLEEESMEV